MFEFLQECDNFSIYERARSCEKIVGDINDVLIFRVFCEAAVKSIYYVENNKQPYGEKINFLDLLNDNNLMDAIAVKYHFNDIGTLNRIARVKGNSAAHDENPDNISDNQREHMFKCIYKLASCIYRVRTGKTAPGLTNEQVQTLIRRKVDAKDIEEIERNYIAEINAIKQELSQQEGKIEKQDEALKKALEDADKARKEAAISEREAMALAQKISKEKYKNINEDELNLKQRLIAEKDELVSRYEGDIRVLKGRLSNAEKSQNDELISKLREKNVALSHKLKVILAEREEYKHQLEELAENTCDRSVVDEMRCRLETLEKESEDKNTLYEQTKRELELERGKQVANNSPIAEYRDLGDEYAKILEIINDLKNMRQQEKERIGRNSPYKCRNCGKKLVLTLKEDAWRCENYKDEIERNLKTAYIKLKECDYFLLKPLRSLDEEIRQKESEKDAWLKKNVPDYDGSQPPIKANKNVVDQYKNKEIDFKEYPYSIAKSEPKSAIFQTIYVPSEVFDRRKELDVGQHSKFRVWFDDTITLNRIKISSGERTIYSLVLRLLNRGIALKSSVETEALLKAKFNDGNYGNLNMLTDYIEYRNPIFVCDSKRELEFATHYFPQVLGKSWASYVTSQVSLEELLPDRHEGIENCRADFLVAGVNHRIKPVVVEIDGYEHKHTVIYDNRRRLALRNNGYEIFSFKNELVDNRSNEINEELEEYFGVEKEEQIVEVNNKYLIACKLQHQFAIAITKALEMGYIPSKTRFNAQVSTTLFSDTDIDYILDTAIIEVEKLVAKFSKLYGIPIDCELDDSCARSISLCVGDGLPGFKGILIRDNYFKYNYPCKLEKFDVSISPVEPIADEVLLFFLDYIFGHKEFRTGQLNAIRRLLNKKNSIVLLPTGSGKSIIYQLSSYLVPGMIVVISPLKSLINDQVSNLELRYGINNAIGIISKSGREGIERRKRDIKHMKCNATSLLYISPERLQMPNFREDITEILENNNVFAVAIDEAHCVSEWGHDFRPAYLVIGKNTRRLFSNNSSEPVLVGLTGTASSKVRSDIQRTLQITDKDAIIYPDSFERDELVFSVIECKSTEKIDNISYMIRNDLPELFDSNLEEFNMRDGDDTKSGIVFTPFTKGASKQYTAPKVAQRLKSDLPSVRTATYYSNVPDGWDRATWEVNIAENAKLFRENEINILVATKAFGMGIDKGNIRYTIHDGIPQSIEGFYQEAGRAGRDRNTSHCIILFSDDNQAETAKLLNPQLDLEQLRIKYNNSDGTDDVHTQLFFHLNGFKGIDLECATLNKVIELLPYQYRPGQSIDIELNQKKNFEAGEIDDNGKRIANAIVRLIYLGIIDDYQYDYLSKKYVIKIGSLERSNINKKFEEYVRSFITADVASQLTKISSIAGNDKNALKQIAKHLVSYTYEQIEAGRRRQLITIYEIMQKVVARNREEQGAVIKDEINKYFALPKSPKTDPIGAIIESSDIRIDIALSTFDIQKGKVSFEKKDKNKASELAGRAARELESVSTRPDLILLKNLAQIVSGEYSPKGVAYELTAVDSFAREKYKIDTSVLTDSFNKIYNLTISIDVSLFDAIVREMANYKNKSVEALVSELMISTDISDDNRDYLVMHYYTEKIRHLL